MSDLILCPHDSVLYLPKTQNFIAPVAAMAAVPGDMSASGSGTKVTLQRGTIAGVGVSVSGLGAWVKVSGTSTTHIQILETSYTYHKMVDSYDIGGGISGFWSWLSFGANASTHHEDIQQTFHEIQTSIKQELKFNIDMMVSGIYPNVQVTASAYVLVMSVTDSQSNTVSFASTGNPTNDLGAQDQSGNNLPVSNNQGTITLPS